uniref:Uncharacterized protein n=1 Tax=Panagrolaimus sp. PS1159 TaxID=55785 RepID=A0AC35FS40_9BILA
MNPFHFLRQQENGRIIEPKTIGFKANQRLLDPNQSKTSNNSQFANTVIEKSPVRISKITVKYLGNNEQSRTGFP